jgi:hypothetical protein
MTFLKKLAGILANCGAVAVGLQPFVQPFLGSGKAAAAVQTGVNDLNAITGVVVQMQVALGDKTGEDRFKAALPLVASILKTSQLVIGKKIENEDAFLKAVQGYTQATFDLLSAIHPDEAK